MLVLASASPRRRELLTQAGFSFTVQPAEIDEDWREGEGPAAYVERLAREKAAAVFSSLAARDAELRVLGADTTVTLEDAILGKPVDAADAARMLRLLSGRRHRVMTGIALATANGVRSAVETTVVEFDALGEEEIAAYVASGEPMDKAGAYGIQGLAAKWIPRIEGCYFNVVGLPLARLRALLREG
jgi:septum formation protein